MSRPRFAVLCLAVRHSGSLPLRAGAAAITASEGRPPAEACGWVAARKCRLNFLYIKYRTNTKGGSSGSPCFTDRWQLVALHHATENSPRPTYNEGIPFAAILARPKVQAALGA
jgi:hypothetical protein